MLKKLGQSPGGPRARAAEILEARRMGHEPGLIPFSLTVACATAVGMGSGQVRDFSVPIAADEFSPRRFLALHLPEIFRASPEKIPGMTEENPPARSSRQAHGRSRNRFTAAAEKSGSVFMQPRSSPSMSATGDHTFRRIMAQVQTLCAGAAGREGDSAFRARAIPEVMKQRIRSVACRHGEANGAERPAMRSFFNHFLKELRRTDTSQFAGQGQTKG